MSAPEKVLIHKAKVEIKADKIKGALKDQLSMTPTTTEQEDITTAGQRRVNLIWEYTQAFIAIFVIASNMIAGLVYAFRGEDGAIPSVLSSSLFLIIGFYFSRTNHQAIGGVGRKSNENNDPYKGR